MKNMEKFKVIFLMVLLIVVVGSMVGCGKYNKPKFKKIEASQSAIKVKLIGDEADQSIFESEKLLEKAKVASKRVQIQRKWYKNGYFPWDGYYQDIEAVYVVERKPETRAWTADSDKGTSNANQAISAETKESIGFSVGMNCSAQIDEKNFVKFLYRYNSKKLTDIMDTDIRDMVEGEFVEECAKYTLKDLLLNKETVMNAVRSKVTSYFAEKGITITVLYMNDGFNYDNDDIQKAIDEKYSSEQKIITQKNENEVIISKAKAEADAKIIEAQAEAKANKLISNSLTDKLINKTYADNWDGKLPTVSGSNGNILDIGGVLGK
jgi:hypothetical protein